ncbi:MAG: undecaprenyl-diphosphate phosphatase [Deltaproteobacteria bacterium]|nr:MAG: undecaprenyl-diphosphate phosphatase [Deltaproteobacteria bacterium]
MSSTAGAAFLGFLQGLTEFLPVSSSGHLVLFQQFFEIAGDEVLFDLVLHLGTLIPVVYFYRDSIAEIVRDAVSGEGPLLERKGVRLALCIVIATIPTGLIGVLFKDLFEQLFQTPAVLTVTFAITGLLLWSTRGRSQGTIDAQTLTYAQAALLGLAQGMAITPGISRSGTTIAVALILGLTPTFAARFSFLMSIPAILGAVVLKLKDVGDAAPPDATQLVVGGLVALVSGYFALAFLVGLVKRDGLSHFSWYCWLAATASGLIAYAKYAGMLA